ncbi:site-specific DNA-methyltransferase [Congregibacter litoralis]|uniref:Methyltransferase n=1 Tax=Congregibacter litoralis KT71 TaxID=314285 RepID=A4ACV0_9GAMM|nr:DNA methyltransferase [Congregibacter litoralis]EAQ96141.1 DNA modification methylase [Congregibacter litoralis KT71]
MKQLQMQYREIASLHVRDAHPRKHPEKQLKKLTQAISASGIVMPLVIDGEGTVFAGAARLEALKRLGITTAPVLLVEHLCEAELRAYALADNRIAEDGDWDEALLKVELTYLIESDVDIDLEVTGFGGAEIDNLLIIENIPPEPAEPALAPEEIVISQPGDVWLAGSHRVMCGSSLCPEQIAVLMSGATATLHISDPPYNVPTQGHISVGDDAGHGDFAMAAGEMTPEEFTDFLRQSLLGLSSVCGNGSLHYIFMDWRHIRELLEAVDTVYAHLINLCVWAKTNGGMGSFYRSQHELIAVAKKGSEPHINNVQLGANGRYRTNVWRYAGMNTFSVDREETLAVHPTVKPTAMIIDAILDASNLGDIVLDGFLGSGTTLLAAEQTGRVCRGMELDPRYADVAIRRWEALTGNHAIHEASGKTFSEVSANTEVDLEEVLS